MVLSTRSYMTSFYADTGILLRILCCIVYCRFTCRPYLLVVRVTMDTCMFNAFVLLLIQEDMNYAEERTQRLLYGYHAAFQRVDHIIKKEDGSLPDFWLQLMREWLLSMYTLSCSP